MTSPSALPKPRLVVDGMGARIEVVGSLVRIKRDGLFGLLITLFGAGDGLSEKTIPIHRMSSVEIVRSFVLHIFCIEYMRFSFPGSPSSAGADWHDTMLEHTVMMNLFDNREFYALKELIEREMEDIRRGNGGATSAAPVDPDPGPEPEPAPVAPEPAWRARLRGWAQAIAGPLVRRVPGGSRGLAAIALAVVALVGSLSWVSQMPLRGGAPVEEAALPGVLSVEDVLPLLGVDNRRTITWEGAGGVAYRATVRGRAYESFLADARRRVAAVGGRAEARFQERLADELKPIFAEVEARIPDYGEWVFNWWTSYILLVRGVGAIVDQVAGGTEQSLEQVTQRVMADEIKARYAQIVLPPDEFRPALRQAVAGAVAAARTELRQACDEFRLRFAGFLIEHAQVVEFQTSAKGWAPDQGWQARVAENRPCAAAGRRLEAAVADLEAGYDATLDATGAIDDVAIRITRPFVTTVVSAGLSASSMAGIAVSLGFPPALVATPAMAAVLTKSAFTLVDLGLSQLDETLNRASFEQAVGEAVARSRAAFERSAVAAAHAAIGRELDDLGLAPRQVSSRPAGDGLLVPTAARP